MQEIAVKDLREGDLVDLSSCPYLKNKPAAEFELAEVLEIERESDTVWCVTYADYNPVGYDPNQLLMVERSNDPASVHH